MLGFRPLGSAPLGTTGSDSALTANPGTVSITNTSALLSTQVVLNAASTASITNTSASLTTQIKMVSSSAVAFTTPSSYLTTVQFISNTGDTILFLNTGASIIALTQIASTSSTVFFASNGPILTTNAPDRGYSFITLYSDFALLDSGIPLVARPTITITEDVSVCNLTTGIQLAANSSLFSFIGTGNLTTGGTKLYSVAVPIGNPLEPTNPTPATFSFGTELAELTCQAFFDSTATEIHIDANAVLKTDFNLQGSSTIGITTSAPLLYGVNFFSKGSNESKVALTSSAYLTVPLAGTVQPGAAKAIKGTAKLNLGGTDLTTIKLAA